MIDGTRYQVSQNIQLGKIQLVDNQNCKQCET